MKRLTFALLGVTAIAASAISFDDASDFKNYMVALQPKFKKAFESKDAKFFDTISTKDFYEMQGKRKLTKAQALAEMKQNFDMTKSIKADFKILSTKVSGKTGIAMTSGKIELVMKPGPPDNKEHKMVVHMWGKETWVKEGNTWKIKILEEAKPSKITMDGKPFDPAMMGG